MSPAPIPTVVPLPRAQDALGETLRNVYAREPRLPDDMMVLLARLNGNGGMRGTR